MSVIALERPAIEAVLNRVNPAEFERYRLRLTSGLRVPGLARYTLHDVPVRFAGVSQGGGVGSHSIKRVGVFVERPGASGLYEPPHEEVHTCDFLVVVRSPTTQEREASALSRSALRIVEAVRLRPGSLEGLESLEITEPFVVC